MSASGSASADTAIAGSDLTYVAYTGEMFLQGIIDLISVDLSEPYSIFTYRYFINNWPNLCFLTLEPSEEAGGTPRVVGVIVCKQDRHRSGTMRGYIAMLAVHHSMRKLGIGRKLVQLAVRAMRDGGCDEGVLETEVTNLGALRLYEGLGFVRDKRLHRYYLNGNDAFRLKVWFRSLDDRPAAPGGGGEAGEAGERDGLEGEEEREDDAPQADGHAAATAAGGHDSEQSA
jgi:peptide alpha-N-acetyltransferase